MLEDLNTVHGLNEKIKELRAGEEPFTADGTQPTPGQWWGRLLDMDKADRLKRLESLLESARKGSDCVMGMHEAGLAEQADSLEKLARSNQQWSTARKLITTFIGTLRKDQEAAIEQGTVADKLEIFLAGGETPVGNNARRILCGHRWTEAGREYQCAEPVSREGWHQGEHYAYVRMGAAADEELRTRYLQEENDALRDRLGLPRNPRRG
jgi:hypothetical protein